MTTCFYCKKEIKEIPYRCKYCGMLFCTLHRIPENHSCEYDLRKKEESTRKLNLRIKYLKTNFLEDVKISITRVIDLLEENSISETLAIDLLEHFLIESQDIEDKINIIIGFGLLNSKNHRIYDILENFFLDEKNHQVKRVIMKVLDNLFPEKVKTLKDWIKFNEN
ncbi:MAG: AN1-type zinc finger domain-containing protein [Promethearchaeota archaeon]